MIKTYNNNGKEFHTITIPKGTALFRGKHFKYDDNVNRLSLFHDLIGIPNNGGHGIAPTYNVFFYPAPYVSNCIQQFNVHIIYITNYDLELYLLIKPSKDHRGQRKKFSIDDVLTECNEYKHIFHIDNVLSRKDIKPVSKKQNSKIKDKLLDNLLKQQLGLI